MIFRRITAEDTNFDALFALRKRFVQALAILGFLVSIGGIMAQLFGTDNAFPLAGILSVFIFVLTSVVVYMLTLYERVTLASVILIVMYSLATLTIPTEGVVSLLATLALIAGATLGSNFWYIVVNVFVFSRFFYGLYLIIQENGFEPVPEGGTITIQISTLVIISVVTRFFITNVEREAQRSARSSYLLRATAEIGEETAKILDQSDLLNKAVNLIQERLAFYHVQVFLIDEDHRYANLVASTGQAGQRLLERGHRLAVGSRSVIGRVAQGGEPVISRDTDSDKVHAVNEFLPNTRSELALPILDGDTIIGALDVQSTRRNAFDSVDIQALQIMANQLATSIRNARLFDAQKQSVEENKRLFLEAEAERREIQRLNGQLTKAAWDSYLKESNVESGITVDQEQGVMNDADWSAYMRQAYKLQRPISRVVNGERVTAVPIILRNEVLGAVEIVSEDLRESDIVEMVQNVSLRLATTLDNIRLFNEAQIATTQEQRINAIVSNYQTASSIDDLLRITLDELSKTLDADESMIRLGISMPPSNGNGSEKHD